MAHEDDVRRGREGGAPSESADHRSDDERRGAADPDRRRFLGNVSRAAMTAGLVGGYGSLGVIAGRYLYPARPSDRIWQFVTELDAMSVGDARRFRAPSGENISIVRQGGGGVAGDFIALSSTCPHLGCQVHWQAHNERYFCPCHNGTFDPSGRATGGPPAEAGQNLGRYPLRVEGGLLFIEVPATRLVDSGRRGPVAASECGISKPGHDRCLQARGRRSDEDKT